MNLVEASWIPVRDHGGSGVFRLLTYEELLCSNGEWQVNLPRDDLELACIQLLVCMTQVMFLPESGGQLRDWHAGPLAPEVFTDGAALCREWFDLDHPTQPFMQSRGVKAAETTPVQKLLIGLPEGNNHAFFNEVGEVKRIGAAAAAIALFNQASNCPSFGGGFKAGLRGGSPVTTLVAGRHLRETLWRNVLPRERINTFLPLWQRGDPDDVPTWVRPIQEGETIQAQSIGLVRGLFWQPAKVELVADEDGECDLLGTKGPRYRGFRKEKFNFSIAGLWPHPHGARVYSDKKDWKFASFTTAAPAWNWLAELVVREFDPHPEAGQSLAFVLTANPIKTVADVFKDSKPDKRSTGVRVPLLKEEQQRDWLTRKLAGIADLDQVAIAPQAPIYFRKANRAGKIVPAVFEGTLRVADGDALRKLLLGGVGPAKAFGCGLLLVRRIS
jgi:CRISPR system Cascade subunit CasA